MMEIEEYTHERMLHMPKPTTAEQVLRAIYEAHADAFSDSRRLSELFAEYSGGQMKPQQNQLDIFLKPSWI